MWMMCAGLLSWRRQKMAPDLYGESFNIGSGVKTTIEDLAQLVRKESSILPMSQNSEAWQAVPGISPIGSADPLKAEKVLGWAATTPLAEEPEKHEQAWVASLSDQQHILATKKKSSAQETRKHIGDRRLL